MKLPLHSALFLSLLGTADLPGQSPRLYDESVVRRIDLVFSQAKWWNQLTKNYSSKTYLSADLVFLGRVYKNVGVRFRGTSSNFNIPVGSKKKPFKVKLNAFVPDQKLLGYQTLNFNNNYADPTWLREVLSYRVYREYGPAPESNWIRLFINGEDFGPYINTQQINTDLLAEWFPSTDGNRYLAEVANRNITPADHSGLTWLGLDPKAYQAAYEIKNNNPEAPWSDLIQACRILNLTSISRLSVEVPKVLDLDGGLAMCAMMNASLWLDSYVGKFCHNYQVYHDSRHGRFVFVPWDPNQSFGTYTDFNLPSSIHRLDPYYGAHRTGRPLMNRVLADPDLKARYQALLRAMVRDRVNWTWIGPLANRFHGLIASHVKTDPEALYPYSMFIDGLTKTVSPKNIGPVPGLKLILEKRSAFLSSHPDLAVPSPVLNDADHRVSSAGQGATVTVKADGAAAVYLHYRIRGPFLRLPMFDDGKHGEGGAGDGVYGAFLPPLPGGARVDYYISARAPTAQGGALSFLPPTISFRPFGFEVPWLRGGPALRINEILAKNTRGARDEKGELEDWIEILNSGSTEIDLGGRFLTDDIESPMKWSFPRGVRLGPGQVLLVWADNEPLDGPLHATFKLSREGEEVALFDRDGRTLIDHFRFGSQEPDVSTGRFIDGGPLWVTFPLPGPGKTNAPPSCGHRLYGSLGSKAEILLLSMPYPPRIGGSLTLDYGGGLPHSFLFLLLGGGAATIQAVGDLYFLVDLPFLAFLPVPTLAGGGGRVSAPLPPDRILIGLRAYHQALGFDPELRLLSTKGLEFVICDKL